MLKRSSKSLGGSGARNSCQAWSYVPAKRRRGSPPGVAGLKAVAPGGDLVVLSGADYRSLVLWDASRGVVAGVANPGGDVRAAFSPGGALWASAGADGRVRFWSASVTG